MKNKLQNNEEKILNDNFDCSVSESNMYYSLYFAIVFTGISIIICFYSFLSGSTISSLVGEILLFISVNIFAVILLKNKEKLTKVTQKNNKNQ